MTSKKTNPPLFLSLPEDIVLNCLARISKSYYPKLSLVSKTFRSIISSRDLWVARCQLGTDENCVYVCLQSLTDYNQSWFSLWMKPNIESSKIILLPIPSSYAPFRPKTSCTVQVGSEIYVLGSGLNVLSSDMAVFNLLDKNRSNGERMKVARKNPCMCVHDEKIYVMGGCEADESVNWGEVFDTKTQTWESLPDPGDDVRGSFIRSLVVSMDMVCFKVGKKYHFYDTEEGKWSVFEVGYNLESLCSIKNEWYFVMNKTCWLCDSKLTSVKQVIDLNDVLDKYDEDSTLHMCNYDGKLVMMWERIEACDQDKKTIWCAVIALERLDDGQVIGKVESVNDVLTVSSSYTFLRCVVESV